MRNGSEGDASVKQKLNTSRQLLHVWRRQTRNTQALNLPIFLVNGIFQEPCNKVIGLTGVLRRIRIRISASITPKRHQRTLSSCGISTASFTCNCLVVLSLRSSNSQLSGWRTGTNTPHPISTQLKSLHRCCVCKNNPKNSESLKLYDTPSSVKDMHVLREKHDWIQPPPLNDSKSNAKLHNWDKNSFSISNIRYIGNTMRPTMRSCVPSYSQDTKILSPSQSCSSLSVILTTMLSSVSTLPCLACSLFWSLSVVPIPALARRFVWLTAKLCDSLMKGRRFFGDFHFGVLMTRRSHFGWYKSKELEIMLGLLRWTLRDFENAGK